MMRTKFVAREGVGRDRIVLAVWADYKNEVVRVGSKKKVKSKALAALDRKPLKQMRTVLKKLQDMGFELDSVRSFRRLVY